MIYIALLSRAAARFANHFFFFSRLSRTGMEFFLGFARDNDSPMLTYAAVLSVIESNNPDYTPGQLYIGSTVLAEYVVLNPKDVPSGLTRHDPTPGVPESFALGPFGLTSGITAWTAVMSMKTRAKQMGTVDLQKGDKVYVSAGSGAVGMMATQIYKSLGADVIASTGSDAKVKFRALVDRPLVGYDVEAMNMDVRERTLPLP